MAIAWGPSITVRHPALPYTLENNVLFRFYLLFIIIDYSCSCSVVHSLLFFFLEL